MLNIQNNKRAFRAALLAGGALFTMTTAALAAGDDVETVVVTGSLIQRSAGDAPTPTMIVGADLITSTQPKPRAEAGP